MKDSSSLFSLDSPQDSFGMYVHIPYCLQKCHYCDFVKFEVNELPPIEDYFSLLFQELEQKRIPSEHKIRSLYLGGGTPSLAPPDLLEKLLQKVFATYTKVNDEIEISLEINPGTLDKSDIQNLLGIGFNRFSLGVQSFQDQFLKACGRQHSAKDSLNDMEAFSSLNLNYSADLLFGLPNQSLEDLEKDLEILCDFEPPHVSPYNLTLPTQHFFNKGRASNEVQAKMMEKIKSSLAATGIRQYEVSNYSKPGKESQHNLLYWTDQAYWGLGMGAHSYFKLDSDWGERAWNAKTYKSYEKFCKKPMENPQQSEKLKKHEALTDYCHTSLRSIIGLNKERLNQKFLSHLPDILWSTLEKLVKRGLLSYDQKNWRLSEQGFRVPNLVFEELCFLEQDL